MIGTGNISRRHRRRLPFLVVTLVGLASCDLSPTYHPQHYSLPASYTGGKDFVVAHPADGFSKGPWWEVFKDAELNTLEAQATAANPTLRQLADAYAQARDIAAEARAGLYPQVSGFGTASDNRRSDHQLFRAVTSSGTSVSEQNTNEWGATATWEPDFWDHIRNQTRQKKQLAQVSAANLADARLSVQAELADDYLSLRGLDADDAIYHKSVAYYRDAVEITSLRLKAEISSDLDVQRAMSQLAGAEALEAQTEGARAVIEHSIAIMIGANPSEFSIPRDDRWSLELPAIPASLPSELLERRPDIAAAEREMAAANTAIGISRASFFPDFVISLSGGFQDSGFELASLPNSLWSVGSTAMLPLFQGGLRHAVLQQSWSQFDQTLANYRETVISAFKDVEDGLSLGEKKRIQREKQHTAVVAALKSQTMTLQLYTAGLTNYLDAVVAQETALATQISEVQARTDQFQTAVNLIRALGGGWRKTDLPAEKDIMPFQPFSL